MIVFLDTETTGLYPGNVCQLSYVIKDKEKARAKNFYFTVDFVDYGATKVHGLTVPKLYELSGGKRFCDFIDEIEGDLESADVIVAHNANFDFMFLREEFSRCGRIFTFKEQFCSMKNSTPVCKIQRSRGTGYKYPKLSELCAYFGVDGTDVNVACRKLFGESADFHDARYDTSALYLAVNAAMESEPSFAKLKGCI